MVLLFFSGYLETVLAPMTGAKTIKDAMETIKESPALLESSLLRLNRHIDSGEDLGTISAGKGDADKNEGLSKLFKCFRDWGYGAIIAIGRTKESSTSCLVIPGATLGYLRQAAERFEHKSILHFSGRSRRITFGTSNKAELAHFHNTADLGVAIMKEAALWDERGEVQAITLEALLVPPSGPCHPHWQFY